jgi:exodeoxyribonuclease V alpha subunit
VFGDSEGVTVLPVARVPHVETVHALTIHKSQGSEFGHTVVVLPKGRSRILTRELLYTGMTRAKPHLTIVATEEALRAAIGTKVQRATGLAGLL